MVVSGYSSESLLNFLAPIELENDLIILFEDYIS